MYLVEFPINSLLNYSFKWVYIIVQLNNVKQVIAHKYLYRTTILIFIYVTTPKKVKLVFLNFAFYQIFVQFCYKTKARKVKVYLKRENDSVELFNIIFNEILLKFVNIIVIFS